MEQASRRAFIRNAGFALGGAVLAPPSDAAPAAHRPPARVEPARFTFFTEEEAAFMRAVIDLILPSDAYGPSASEAGVLRYIDLQLAGDFGSGARHYMQGPFQQGSRSQGYQVALTPAKLYRFCIEQENRRLSARYGGRLDALAPAIQQAQLKDWADGRQDIAGVPAQVFFQHVYANTIEGYYADPRYGGNRGAASWKIIGYPGANPVLGQAVSLRNRKYSTIPISIDQ